MYEKPVTRFGRPPPGPAAPASAPPPPRPVAMIHQCQTSEASAAKFRGLLEEFYSDSPDRLKNALYGLSLMVRKPGSDLEQD